MAIIKGSDWGGSRISTFQTCKQKYYLAYEAPHPDGGNGLITIEDKVAPAKGSLIHLGLQHYYEGIIAAPKESKEKLYVASIKEAISHVEEFDIPPELMPLLKDEIISAFDQYFTKYELEDIIPLEAEEPFNLSIGNLVHTGIIDLFGMWHDELFVIDHKTTSLRLDQFFKKFRFDLSLMGYAKAKSEEMGRPIGVLINAIRFKKDKAMTVELDREPIMYSPGELEDDFPRTIQAERRNIEQCQTDNFWPKSGNQCVQVWGDCEMRRMCIYNDPSMAKTFYKARSERGK
jgi:hypothetical protein